MVTLWLIAALAVQILPSAAAEEPKAIDCPAEGCSIAEVFVSEDEDEGSLHLLQRRQWQRVQEHRQAEDASHGLPPPFAEDDDGPVIAANSFLDDGLDSNPPPLTPIVVPKHKKRSSVNLHFNAVMRSCNPQLGNPHKCDSVVSKSAKSVFTQLHVKARVEQKIPPLSRAETHAFRKRFSELVVGGSKSVVVKPTKSEQYHGWKKLVYKGYDNMRPVVPESMVEFINSDHSGVDYVAGYDDSFVQVSVAKGKSKLGLEITQEEEEMMKNETLQATEADLLEIDEEELKKDAFGSEFDVREHWPDCRPVTGHVRYQTCNNCWSHSTALITESRLCIKTGGSFNGPNAWLSQSFIAACRMDGKNYCNGGSGLLGFRTVTRWGVPTGGPDFRGNIAAGVQTCYPQILPNEQNVHCPGACSPFSHYPRTLQQDTFYVQYAPRALHPAGAQTPYLVKKALVEDGPILLGMRIYQDFYAYKSGTYKPVKKSWNRYMGGHAVTGMGFGPGYVLAINSWSVAWGMRGAFQVAPDAIDYGYFIPGHMAQGAGLGSASHLAMPLPHT